MAHGLVEATGLSHFRYDPSKMDDNELFQAGYNRVYDSLEPETNLDHARNESRGAHYKPDFPDRDDTNWLKTTRAKWVNGDVQLTYEPVDTSQIAPRPRRYDALK